MRTNGSIDVKRAVKPFKYGVVTKEKNHMSAENGIVLLRGGRNIKYLMKANMELKGTIYNAARINAAR